MIKGDGNTDFAIFQRDSTFVVHFFFFFFDLDFTALSRIFHLYQADCSSKVGENRTRGKTTWPSVSRTWLSHMWPEWCLNHSGEKPNKLSVNSPITRLQRPDVVLFIVPELFQKRGILLKGQHLLPRVRVLFFSYQLFYLTSYWKSTNFHAVLFCGEAVCFRNNYCCAPETKPYIS